MHVLLRGHTHGGSEMPLLLIQGLEVMELQGTAGEMGYEHGRLMKDRIQLGLEQFVRRSQTLFEVPYQFLCAEARKLEKFIPPLYLEEMRALSEASEVSFEEMLAINCMVDLDAIYMQRIMQCCNFVLGMPATRDGLFLHGRNLDFPHGKVLNKMGIVVVRKPASGAVPTLGVSWVGFVGMLTGCNAAQLTVAEVGTPARDVSINGVPVTCLLRAGLERSSDPSDFCNFLRAAPRTAGFNIAVSDGKTEDAAAVEITSRLCERRNARDGTLIVDNLCLCRKTSLNRLTYAAGALRYARMVQLVHENYGRIDAAVAMQFLKDKFDSVFRTSTGHTYNSICNDHTIHSVLFLPKIQRLYVSHSSSPAPAGPYHEVDVSKLW